MSEPVTDWLPKAAFSEGVVRAALSGPIGDWSVHWFAEHRATVAASSLFAELEPADAQSLRLARGAISADLTEHGKWHLLNALLDVDVLDCEFSDGDRAVLAAFVTGVIENLLRRLEDTLGIPAKA